MKKSNKEALGYLSYRLGWINRAYVTNYDVLLHRLKRGSYFRDKFHFKTATMPYGAVIPFKVLSLEQVQYLIRMLKSHGVDAHVLANIMQRWSNLVPDTGRFFFLHGDN